jgi:hypothetical protein
MLILALPFEATAKLLPKMPANAGAAQLAPDEEAEHWPICSVHLWLTVRLRSSITPCCSTAIFTGCITSRAGSHARLQGQLY